VEIRFASIADGATCNWFYNNGHQKRRTLAQWEWEFVSRDFSQQKLLYVVAEDQGHIVGTQALIPIRMVDGNGVFWTAKSEETLVSPAYRGQQIFEKMYDLLKQYAQSSGIRCIWGFTPATRAFTRIGFETPGKTSQVFFPFSGDAITVLLNRQAGDDKGNRPSRISRMAYRIAGTVAGSVSSLRFKLTSSAAFTGSQEDSRTGLHFRLLTGAPAEAGEACRSFVHQWGGCTILRDTAYLQWRLFDNPYVRALFWGAYVGNQLCGWVAYALGDDGMGYLVDMIAVDRERLRVPAREIVKGLLSTAVNDLRQMGALGMRGWHVNNHQFDKLVLREAKALGFWHIKRGHDVVVLYVPGSATEAGPADFQQWFVTRIYTEGLLG